MSTRTRLIPLTQGKFAVVDAIDFEWLNQWKWTAMKPRHPDYPWYAKRKGPTKAVLMHREIAKRAGLRESKLYDHHDGDGLNNTRRNVRPCNQGQNNANGRKRTGTRSRYKGLSWHKRRNQWLVRIGFAGKEIFLGWFDDEQDAANTYATAARQHYREFARFPTCSTDAIAS